MYRSLDTREDQGSLTAVSAGITASALSFGYLRLSLNMAVILIYTGCSIFSYSEDSLVPSLVVH